MRIEEIGHMSLRKLLHNTCKLNMDRVANQMVESWGKMTKNKLKL